MRIGLLAVGGWIVAAVLTIGASWSAINVVRESVVPLTEVASALPTPDEGAATTAAPTTTRPSTGPTVAAALSLSGQGGSVTARCTNGVPAVVRIVPKQGFTAKPDDSGREVQFSSSDHRTQITIACNGDTPLLNKDEKATSGGGGGGSGRGGGGGGDN